MIFQDGDDWAMDARYGGELTDNTSELNDPLDARTAAGCHATSTERRAAIDALPAGCAEA